jgi:Tfp pilus assembly protein PilF
VCSCVALVSCASHRDLLQAEIQHDLGVEDLRQGRLQQALRAFEEAVSLADDFPQAFNGLGLTQHFLGNEQKAIEAFQRALKLKPDFSEVKANLGRVHLSRGRFREALPLLEEALEDVFLPERYVAEANLGWAQFQIGMEEEGLRRVMTALAQNEGYCVAHEFLGFMHQKRQTYDEAIESFKILIQKCPGYVQGLLNLAKVYLLAGDETQGCLNLEACVQKGRMSLVGQECTRLQRLSCGSKPSAP